MNVHFSYRLPRTPDIDREIQHGTEKVRKRLQVFRPELVHLKGSVEQNSSREGLAVSLNLRLPSGQMAAQETAASATAAIKAAFESLLGQIGKHKELLRNSHKWRRRRTEQGRPLPQVPFEQTVASVPPLTATGEDVRSYVNANFRRLHLFVERELYFRESSGDIESEAISAEEIVDQAVADALDDKVEKPDRIGIEPWLYRLAIRAIDDFVARRAASETEIELRGIRQRRRESASDEARLGLGRLRPIGREGIGGGCGGAGKGKPNGGQERACDRQAPGGFAKPLNEPFCVHPALPIPCHEFQITSIF